MPDLKTILVIFGVIFLMILFTRKAILKQKASPAPGLQRKEPAPPTQEISRAAFERSWKSLGYLLLLAALGHLYVLYLSVNAALESGSYIYWIDAGLSLASAAAAVLIWRLKRQWAVMIYAGLTILPIFFFMSTGHTLEALIRLFPLVLVYLVVQPVWHAMTSPPDGVEPNT